MTNRAIGYDFFQSSQGQGSGSAASEGFDAASTRYLLDLAHAANNMGSLLQAAIKQKVIRN